LVVIAIVLVPENAKEGRQQALICLLLFLYQYVLHQGEELPFYFRQCLAGGVSEGSIQEYFRCSEFAISAV
jgi:hypothetical protein